MLLREGERSGELGVVLTGLLTLEKTDRGGNLNLIAQAGPGELFGDPAACAAAAAAACRCAAPGRPGAAGGAGPGDQALQPRLRVPFPPGAEPAAAAGAGQPFAGGKDRGAQPAHHPRKAALLPAGRTGAAGSPRFTLPLSRSGLADYICADRSAMTRELGRMQKEGLLELRGRAVYLPE